MQSAKPNTPVALTLGDVLALVASAHHRVKLGEASDFGAALFAVVVDAIEIREGRREEPRGVLYDGFEPARDA